MKHFVLVVLFGTVVCGLTSVGCGPPEVSVVAPAEDPAAKAIADAEYDKQQGDN